MSCSDDDLKNNVPIGTVTAKLCFDLVVGEFNDWHLPSQGEAELLYENLHLEGLGNFEANPVNPV